MSVSIKRDNVGKALDILPLEVTRCQARVELPVKGVVTVAHIQGTGMPDIPLT